MSGSTPNMSAFCNNIAFAGICNAINAMLVFLPDAINNAGAHPNFPSGVSGVYQIVHFA